jgi:hypothetical protein
LSLGSSTFLTTVGAGLEHPPKTPTATTIASSPSTPHNFELVIAFSFADLDGPPDSGRAVEGTCGACMVYAGGCQSAPAEGIQRVLSFSAFGGNVLEKKR